MTPWCNEFGQPVGPAVPGWAPPPRPGREVMAGRFCRLEPLDPGRHAAGLFEALSAGGDAGWTYLPYGPFQTPADHRAWVESHCLGDDPLFFVIVESATGRAVGQASYLNIKPAQGSIEVGHLYFSPLMKRSRVATEAMFLMMRRAFELGYRRYEWKCDALNAPSRAAAERFGFSYEGIFRQAIVVKGRNRDTAWYAAIDGEWPLLSAAFEAWLDPSNFDEAGQQKASLRELRRGGP